MRPAQAVVNGPKARDWQRRRYQQAPPRSASTITAAFAAITIAVILSIIVFAVF